MLLLIAIVIFSALEQTQSALDTCDFKLGTVA